MKENNGWFCVHVGLRDVLYMGLQVDGTADERITIRGAGGWTNRENVVLRGAGKDRVLEINHDFYTIQVCLLLLRGRICRM